MDKFLSELNDAQKAAVIYDEGPSLVIAGAGSGKTRVITYKIAYLINKGYNPNRIMALTFTNKAAREMTSRISAILSDKFNGRMWAGTFHSIFLRLLRLNHERIGFSHDFTIYDSADSKSLIKMIIKDMELDDKVYKPNTIQSMISNLKNNLVSPQRYMEDKEARKSDEIAKRPLFYKIYLGYMARCKSANAMDFDDILYYMNILLRDNPDITERYQDYFQYVLVDEYQDTNIAQHLIVYQLTKKYRKLCVVGDDAQSIYSFRGANIQNILNLKRHYPDLITFKLEQNYRSTQTILDAANSLIAKNHNQIPKKIFTENERGAKIPVINSFSADEEAYMAANKVVELKMIHHDTYDDYAILYRTNAQSRKLEEAFRKRNIPYKIYGGVSFYQRKEVKDVVAYMRLAINPNDDEALKRVINFPKRGIGDATVAKIYDSAVQANCSMWHVLTSELLMQVGLNKGTINKLEGFKDVVKSFVSANEEGMDAGALVVKIVHETKLPSLYLSENTPENVSKLENIQELVNGAKEFVETCNEEGNDDTTLSAFLSQISLATDQDSDDEQSAAGRVLMMTIHAAKGLEFNTVIIVGVEEELFPSSRSVGSVRELEEERRLMYVAITRAKRDCIISYANWRYHANWRYQNGELRQCVKSRFIKDIAPQYLAMSSTASARYNFNESYEERPQYVSSWSAPIQQRTSKVVEKAITPKADNPNLKDGALKVGTRIRHFRFGEGTIINISDEDNMKIDVSFDNLGEKTLLVKFAKFDIID